VLTTQTDNGSPLKCEHMAHVCFRRAQMQHFCRQMISTFQSPTMEQLQCINNNRRQQSQLNKTDYYLKK